MNNFYLKLLWLKDFEHTVRVIDEMLDRCESLIRLRHFRHTFTCTLHHGTSRNDTGINDARV